MSLDDTTDRRNDLGIYYFYDERTVYIYIVCKYLFYIYMYISYVHRYVLTA